MLVCNDELVVECFAEQATDGRLWLEKAMVKGMDTVFDGTDEVDVPVEVELG